MLIWFVRAAKGLDGSFSQEIAPVPGSGAQRHWLAGDGLEQLAPVQAVVRCGGQGLDVPSHISKHFWRARALKAGPELRSAAKATPRMARATMISFMSDSSESRLSAPARLFGVPPDYRAVVGRLALRGEMRNTRYRTQKPPAPASRPKSVTATPASSNSPASSRPRPPAVRSLRSRPPTFCAGIFFTPLLIVLRLRTTIRAAGIHVRRSQVGRGKDYSAGASG